MRSQETTTAPGYDRMQDQLLSWLTGNTPVAETIDVILSLKALASPEYLDKEGNEQLLQLIAFLNQVQLVQFNMGRMVHHA